MKPLRVSAKINQLSTGWRQGKFEKSHCVARFNTVEGYLITSFQCKPEREGPTSVVCWCSYCSFLFLVMDSYSGPQTLKGSINIHPGSKIYLQLLLFYYLPFGPSFSHLECVISRKNLKVNLFSATPLENYCSD